MNLPPHDFASSLALASGDADLNAQLTKFFCSAELSSPGKSPLVDATVDAMTWVLQDARGLYATNPERLVGAISSSAKANALAVWSSSGRDWIVVSEGLMESLRASADDLGDRVLAAFPEISEFVLMRRLQAMPPCPGGFRTSLGSFLYCSAIAFFTGHEAGHHLAGHDGFYAPGAHAELTGDGEDSTDPAWLTKQALEREADQHGLRLCRMYMVKLLSKLWGAHEHTDAERFFFQLVLAVLTATGSLAAVLHLKPQTLFWEKMADLSHPPRVLRILALSLGISNAIKQGLGDLDSVSRSFIPIKCLDEVLAATIRPGSDADRIYKERVDRGGEPAALRATGLRAAVYDPRMKAYFAQLESALGAVKKTLEPRTRA